MVMATCEARWIGSHERAQALLSAIEADDPDMFTAEITEGQSGEAVLTISVTADSISSLQSIMDDLLACLSAAEVSLDAIQG
jgi:ethanolamine ammonia-lyase large subunit